MSGDESCDREAGAAIGGQPTDDDPTAATCLGDGYGGEIRVATVQNGNSTPRSGNNAVDGRRQGDGQLGQRRVADIDAGAPTTKAKAVKN